MFERHFVAYGVRIGLRADCRALLDTLDRDPRHLNLPFGWRAVGDHEPDAPASVQYDLLTGVSSGACPTFRLYSGVNLVADARRLTDVGPALLALMRHTVAARGNPAHSMPILKQAVSAGIALAGPRSEARPLVSAVLTHGVL